MLRAVTAQSPNLLHPDDHFPFCPTGFDVSHRLVGLFKRKNLVQNRFYRPRIDERGDFAQLFAGCFHKKKGKMHAEAFCLSSDARAQNLKYQFQKPISIDFLPKSGVGRAGNRNNFSAGFQNPQRFFERFFILAVQNYIVIFQNGLKVVLSIVNHDIRAEAFHQIKIGRTGRRGNGRADMLRQLDGKSADAARTGLGRLRGLPAAGGRAPTAL